MRAAEKFLYRPALSSGAVAGRCRYCMRLSELRMQTGGSTTIEARFLLMKRSLLALAMMAAVPALALSAAASAADGLSYSYVEGGYVATDADGGDAEGFGGNASFAVHPNFHVFGGYSHQEIDSSDVDFDQWRLGVGYNHPVAANTDLVTRIAYENFRTDDFRAGGVVVAPGVDADGYSAEVGVRSALTPMLEGYALAGYEDGDQFDGDLYGRLGAQVKFNRNWGVSGDVKIADGDTQWMVGPRFTW